MTRFGEGVTRFGEVVANHSDGVITLRIVATNGAFPTPAAWQCSLMMSQLHTFCAKVRIKYRTRNGMARAGERHLCFRFWVVHDLQRISPQQPMAHPLVVRYQQKSGVLHFLPEDEIAELPLLEKTDQTGCLMNICECSSRFVSALSSSLAQSFTQGSRSLMSGGHPKSFTWSSRSA